MRPLPVEQDGRLVCSECGHEILIDDEDWSVGYFCPEHGWIVVCGSGGKRYQRRMAIAQDPQNYTLTLLEMPAGKLRTIATIAGLTRKPSWLLRELYIDGQWSYPETFSAQGILDMLPALKQRGLPFKIEPEFPWLDEVPDPETPPPA